MPSNCEFVSLFNGYGRVVTDTNGYIFPNLGCRFEYVGGVVLFVCLCVCLFVCVFVFECVFSLFLFSLHHYDDGGSVFNKYGRSVCVRVCF